MSKTTIIIRIRRIVVALFALAGVVVLVRLVSGMGLFWRDLLQAISDVGPQLFLIGALLIVLFLAGWWLRGVSLRRQLVAEDLVQDAKHEKQAARMAYSASFWQGISTEMFGAVITTFCFGVILLVFQQYQLTRSRKADLLLHLGSVDSVISAEAVRELRILGWLDDALAGKDLWFLQLAGADLSFADLTNTSFAMVDLTDANLKYARLEGANFHYTDLIDANLKYAELEGANFEFTNLTGADLSYTDLTGAQWVAITLTGADLSRTNLEGVSMNDSLLGSVDLSFANLKGASLWRSDLRGANLTNANLAGANMRVAYLAGADLTDANLDGALIGVSESFGSTSFDEYTILPDGSNYIYEEGIEQLQRFTDPNHPDFWRSDYEFSPAYRGDDMDTNP